MSQSDLFSLKNKNILITGGAGILGEYFSDSLMKYGANLVILDSNEEKGLEIKNKLEEKHNRSILFFKIDITIECEIINVLKKINNKIGNIDVLINNAASKTSNLRNFFKDFESYDLETWESVMSQNVNSMFLINKIFGNQMIKKNIKGSIIQISSIYGVFAPDQRIYEGSEYLNHKINSPAVYSVSKSAVIGFTKYLAAYWGQYGIRVNTISPGGVFSGQNNIFVEKYSNRVPLNRMANPEEIVGALVFLASDASSYITGQNIIIDGGLSCW